MRKFRKGFTFIELMVAISIAMIIAVILLPQYQKFRQRQAVKSAALEVKSDVINAIAESKKREQYVFIIFNGKDGYKVVRDDDEDKDPSNNTSTGTGLIRDRQLSQSYLASTFSGLTDGDQIAFGDGGKVVKSYTNTSGNTITLTSLTANSGTNISYYSLTITGAGDGKDYEVRIYEDGTVKLIEP